MSIENSKASEIKRLTTPLKIQDSKAYDDKGNVLKCVETLSDVRFIHEPKEGILSDDEILQYAPQSKAASAIRLKRGFGDNSDVLLIHNSLPWVFSFYYVVLICISIPIFAGANRLAMFVVLIAAIIPLAYMYRAFNFKRYAKIDKPKNAVDKTKTVESNDHVPVVEDAGLESLKGYEKEITNLKILFDVKENVVRDLIAKRFEPPQITYDKFISMIDSSHKLFYIQSENALNIINLASDDSPRVRGEIENKIDAMKTIINQIEDLTNELVININNDGESTEEVKALLEDMENLIGSVKEY